MPSVELVVDPIAQEYILVPFASNPSLGGIATSSGPITKFAAGQLQSCAESIVQSLATYKSRKHKEPSEFYVSMDGVQRDAILKRSTLLHIVTIPRQGFGKIYIDLNAPEVVRFLLPLHPAEVARIVMELAPMGELSS